MLRVDSCLIKGSNYNERIYFPAFSLFVSFLRAAERFSLGREGVETNCSKNMEGGNNCSRRKVIETNATVGRRKVVETNCSMRKMIETNCSKNMEGNSDCSRSKMVETNYSRRNVSKTNCSRTKVRPTADRGKVVETNCSRTKVVETNCSKNIEGKANCSRRKVVKNNCTRTWGWLSLEGPAAVVDRPERPPPAEVDGPLVLVDGWDEVVDRSSALGDGQDQMGHLLQKKLGFLK